MRPQPIANTAAAVGAAAAPVTLRAAPAALRLGAATFRGFFRRQLDAILGYKSPTLRCSIRSFPTTIKNLNTMQFITNSKRNLVFFFYRNKKKYKKSGFTF